MDLRKDCIAHWRFEESGDSRLVLDCRGILHGLASRPTKELSCPGLLGNAFAFNGAGDHIHLGSSLQEYWRKSFTVCGWVQRIDCEQEVAQSLWGIIGNDYENILEIDENSDEVLFNYICDSKWTQCGSTFIPDSWRRNEWCFVAAILDVETGQSRLWWNNTLLKSTSLAEGTDPSKWTSPLPFLLGAAMPPGGVPFSVRPLRLDNLMLFGRALTNTELLVLYNDGNGRESLTDSPESGLLTELEDWACRRLSEMTEDGRPCFRTVAPWAGQVGIADGGVSSFERYAPMAFVQASVERLSREGDYAPALHIILDIAFGDRSGIDGAARRGGPDTVGVNRLFEKIVLAFDRSHPGPDFCCDEFYLSDAADLIVHPKMHYRQVRFEARWIPIPES
ncbi:MAG TPA: hypothetical protein PKY88_12630 [Anaerohalosphaeraceae bacterium]|nr:hypothetical protein [Anaerohalosphaeraceae bacterium]